VTRPAHAVVAVFTIMASVKGMAPNTISMKPIAAMNSAQSWNCEAIRTAALQAARS